jgi:hypothetical protein
MCTGSNNPQVGQMGHTYHTQPDSGLVEPAYWAKQSNLIVSVFVLLRPLARYRHRHIAIYEVHRLH